MYKIYGTLKISGNTIYDEYCNISIANIILKSILTRIYKRIILEKFLKNFRI